MLCHFALLFLQHRNRAFLHDWNGFLPHVAVEDVPYMSRSKLESSIFIRHLDMSIAYSDQSVFDFNWTSLRKGSCRIFLDEGAQTKRLWCNGATDKFLAHPWQKPYAFTVAIMKPCLISKRFEWLQRKPSLANLCPMQNAACTDLDDWWELHRNRCLVVPGTKVSSPCGNCDTFERRNSKMTLTFLHIRQWLVKKLSRHVKCNSSQLIGLFVIITSSTHSHPRCTYKVPFFSSRVGP